MNIVLYQSYAREQFLYVFKDLANREHQLKEWTALTSHNTYWDNLCEAVFDDMYFANYSFHRLRGNSISSIGCFLYDQEEVEAIDRFILFLDKLVEEIGDDQPDEAYLDHPQWPLVWEGAEKVVQLMERKNLEYNFEISEKVDELYPELLDKAAHDKDQAARDELERLGYHLLIPRNLSQSSDAEPNVTR